MDKYNEMKQQIRGRQKQVMGLTDTYKNELTRRGREEAIASLRTTLLKLGKLT